MKINAALLPSLAPPERTAFFGVNLTQPLVKPTGARCVSTTAFKLETFTAHDL